MSQNLQDSNSKDENGKYHINFRNESDSPLTHGEMDFNLSLLGQTIQGYRVMGTSADGSLDLINDLDKTLKLHKITIDDTALIAAGAKLDEYIWLTSNAGSGGIGIGGTVTSHLIPDADVTYDLGSPSNKFRDLYLSNNTIYLGDDVISTTGGNIKVNNVELVKADTFLNDATASAENLGIETQLRTEAIADINLSLSSLSTENGALAQAVTDLDTSFTAELTNAITGETLARTTALSGINETLISLSDGHTAQATKFTELDAKFTTELNNAITGESERRTEAIAGINEELTAITNADFASASSVTELGTQFTTQIGNETTARTEAIAGVKSQIDAVSSATSAAATKVDTLESSFNTTVNDAVLVETTAREQALLDEAAARASEIQAVSDSIPSEFNTDGLATTAELQEEAANRVSAIAEEAAERARLLGIEAETRISANSSIETRLTTLNTANLSNATKVDNLSASFNSDLVDSENEQNLLRTNAIASVETRLTALSTSDLAMLEQVNTLGTDFSIEIAAAVSGEGDIRAAAITDVTNQIIALSDADGANVTRLNTLEAQYTIEGGNITGISESSAVKTTIDSAVATANQATISSTTSLIAQLDESTSGVLETQSADINALTGKVNAQYTLEVNADGNVAGMKLGADENGSTIAFTADSFKVSSEDSNGTLLTPFSIVDGQVAFNGAVSFSAGPAGPAGADGINGTDGADGAAGADGADGAAGADGADGADGYTPVKGTDYFDGVDGQDGADGDSAYNAWLAAGNTGSTTDFLNSLVGQDGTDGSDGIEGAQGANGQTTYTWIRYADSGDGSQGFSNSPADKKYIGFAFNKTTSVESTNRTDYTWSLIKGADGADGYTPVKGTDYFDGVDGQDGADGDSAYNAWLAAGNTGSTTDFLNSLVGQDGTDGSDGIEGAQGANGQTTYTWIRYADSGDGIIGFFNSPAEKGINKPYIGFAFNKTTSVESENPADYTWSLIKGNKGDTGSQGSTGVKGSQGAAGAKGDAGAQGAAGVVPDLSDYVQTTTTIYGGTIETGILKSGHFAIEMKNSNDETVTDLKDAAWDGYAIQDPNATTNVGMGINLSKGAINAKNFYLDPDGNAKFRGDLDLAGNVTVGGSVMADFFAISNEGNSNGKLIMRNDAYLGDVKVSDFKNDVSYKSDDDELTEPGGPRTATLSHTHIKRNDVLIEVGDLVKLDYNNELIKASSSKDTGIVGILWEEIDYSIKPSVADKYVSTPRVFIEQDHHYRDSFGNKLQEIDRDSKSLWRVASIGDSVEKDLLGMKVCNQNGPVLVGDLVCSSDTPGYVMKQPVEYVITNVVDGIPQYELRQIMAPFTVGKCMQNCSFDSNGKVEGIYGYLYCG